MVTFLLFLIALPVILRIGWYMTVCVLLAMRKL
jgi:hypothetical protein